MILPGELEECAQLIRERDEARARLATVEAELAGREEKGRREEREEIALFLRAERQRCLDAGDRGGWIDAKHASMVAALLAELVIAIRARGQAPTRVPVGTPGVRDPDAPCEDFALGQPGGTCEGDGHYLCRECAARERA